ncbi:MAG: undecaprenyl-diphosphate phosphatase, partial [Clostridiales bacterium]|nr:undecaprenyl-diphosphate phosphatase [Clostridiales bacterium]
MTAVQALILGIVQGLGEFLPISSSGHLVLVQKLFGIEEGAMSFDIIVHLGTLVSLCVVMRKQIFAYLRAPLGHVPRMVVLATVPTVVIALAFNSILEGLFETGFGLGFCFLYTAAILWFAETHNSGVEARREGKRIEAVSPRDALLVGISQGIATIPAVSRSGSTIAGGLLSGLRREAAIEFAFLMSIPVTLMAVAFDLL